MSDSGSVTNWIAELKRGEQSAAQKMWERYVQRLVSLARTRLATSRKRMADEEDVAAAAFEHFWIGLQQGRFPRLDDRNDLWQILVMLTDRRAADVRRRSQTRSRHEVGESGLAVADGSPRELAQIVGQEPTAEFAVELSENLAELLKRLEDKSLEKVALWKLQGYQHSEIAQMLGCVERTVERKVKMIRDRLSGD